MSRGRRGRGIKKERVIAPHRNFSTYIYKVLKQVHPDTGISQRAMAIMNDYILDFLRRVASEAANVCDMNGKFTLSARDIQTAVRLTLPGELAKHGVSEGTKAVTKFNSAGQGGGGPKVSKSFKAGLQFPVGRIHTFLKNGRYANRIGKTAAIYLAAVAEYLTAEVLELSGNASRDNKLVRIAPRHIHLAVANDEELHKYIGKGIIAGGGVLPNIHSLLLPRKMSKMTISGGGYDSQDY